MSEYLVLHTEGGKSHVLFECVTYDDAVDCLQFVVDCAVSEGAIVSVPCIDGQLAQDRARVKIIDPAYSGEYVLRIMAICPVEA